MAIMNVSVGVKIFALAGFEPVFKGALVSFTVKELVVTFAVEFVIVPVSDVNVAVFVFENAFAGALIGLVEFALVIRIIGEVFLVYVGVDLTLFGADVLVYVVLD
jgi:hypothetical protein